MNKFLRHRFIRHISLLAILAAGDERAISQAKRGAEIVEAPLPPQSVEKIAQPSVPHMAMTAAPLRLQADATAEKLIRETFTSGNYPLLDELVRRQLDDASVSPSYKSWLRSQTPVIRLGWAWALIRQKKCDDALPLLESTPDQSAQFLSWKGMGYCLMQRKDFATASSYLERYLEKNNNDPEAYVLLSEVKESLGETTEAWELTQKATSLKNLTDEETQELKRRESSLNAKAEESAGQVEITAGFIRLRYQASQHQSLVPGSMQVLERTIETLNQQLGLPYPPEPIEVIFHPAENFGRVAHSPDWTAGLYDGRVRIPVSTEQTLNEEFARVLRHEITHAVLSEHAQHRRLPAWFQEGLAQVAECPELCWHFDFAATSFPFLAAQAFDDGFLKLNRGEAQVAYKQSFYLMQVLYYQLIGLPGIRQIIEQIPLIQDLSSDGLMDQVRQNFVQVHQKAQESWSAQRSF